MSAVAWKNKLYYGDNLVWLHDHDHFPNEFVDLIYLDPPFNSNADYNVIFSEPSGAESQAQLRAFDDTWRWDSQASASALDELSSNKPEVAEFIGWLGSQRDKSSRSMAAYLGMMATRLLEMHRVLKPTGSVYLHCDPTAGHYLKILMDVIFGVSNFTNEVIWYKNSGGIGRTSFNKRHDTLLAYHKTKNYFYDGKAVGDLREQNEGTFGGYFGVDEDGRRFRGVRRGGKIYRYYLDEPKNPDDVWVVPQIPERDKTERLGYPTQKPYRLLDRVIKASSPQNGIVLDPFCGCGTTLVVAHKLKRRWVGIDITHLSIYLVEQRLKDSFGEETKDSYDVHGNPYDVPSAQALWNKNPKEFELWALSLVGARPRARDGGVDGVLGFVDKDKKVQKVIVQVKGGAALTPSIVRDLIGTVENEKAVMGLLITLHESTSGMTELAVHAGTYKSELWGRLYPRIQIRTIEDLMIRREQFDLPPQTSSLKQAARIKEQGQTQPLL